jgi:hypothetical protein
MTISASQPLDALPCGRVEDKNNIGTGGLAGTLPLAATPVFGFMALLTALDNSPIGGLCSTGHGTPLTGMVTMYLLMSVFHSPAWFRFIAEHKKRWPSIRQPRFAARPFSVQ